jgi:hypothetical protein
MPVVCFVPPPKISNSLTFLPAPMQPTNKTCLHNTILTSVCSRAVQIQAMDEVCINFHAAAYSFVS